jgi:hypothetical protein
VLLDVTRGVATVVRSDDIDGYSSLAVRDSRTVLLGDAEVSFTLSAYQILIFHEAMLGVNKVMSSTLQAFKRVCGPP